MDFQSVIQGPFGVPENLSVGTWGQNYFQNNIKTLFAFLTLILSQVEFSWCYMTRDILTD